MFVCVCVCVKGQKGGWRSIRRAALFLEINLEMNGSRLAMKRTSNVITSHSWNNNNKCSNFIFHETRRPNTCTNVCVCMWVLAFCSPFSSNQSKIQIGRFNYESFQVLIYYYATNIAILHNIITFFSPLIIAGESCVSFSSSKKKARRDHFC